MKCPKCNIEVEENTKVCPQCHKVLILECPNCHSHSKNSVCDTCGYIILTKCAKCGKKISTSNKKCKCGFPVSTSIVTNECETDEYACLVIKFESLRNIRKQLSSQDLFAKFYYKLRNLLFSQLKGLDGRIITYSDTFVINFNKELSFSTSSDKAVRLALKILNSFTELNSKVIEEFTTPLKLSIIVTKKNADELLLLPQTDNDVKLLTVKKNEKKYLKGLQVVLDQYVYDCVNKNYKTDSLYSIELNGNAIMYYEIILDQYIIPPEDKVEIEDLQVIKQEIKKPVQQKEEDIYSYNIFEIDALCKFKKISAENFFRDFENNKIVALRGTPELQVDINSLVNHLNVKGFKTLHVSCTEELNFKPWGILEQIFREYHKLSFHNTLIENSNVKLFKDLMELVLGIPRKSASPEDARFAYIEDFGNFLASLKGYTVIIEGLELVDDTTLQTLELFFDRFKNLNVNFIFIMNENVALHSKFNNLLRTTLYTEYLMQKSSIDSLLATIKEEASDFVQSFYFEKIKENFNGSKLYFDNAIKYLFENDILLKFEDRLLIKNNKSVLLPPNTFNLLKSRLKHLSKTNSEASLILAYTSLLGARLDFATLNRLGVKELDKNIKILEEKGYVYVRNEIMHVNNFSLIKPVIEDSLKPEVVAYLAKNILANIGKGLDDTSTLITMGKIQKFKEEYLLLWKNSQFCMATGDYDAYLKNCLGFLSLIEHIDENIAPEDIENNKKEVYQNILMSLYNYSPEKIYSIENILLLDAIEANDNDKIVKLSNLMLQGALLSSNYKDALALLHNILTRMPDSTLLVNGAINTKFLLLSLVNIEILFNIGDYAQCVEITKDLLAVITPEIINKIKPASFSTNLFVTHMLETFRLVGFAKLFMGDDDLDNYFNAIKESLNTELPEKECLLTLQDFFSGKEFFASNIAGEPAFSKIIYLILQEFSLHQDDLKTFAQNIHQAKLLAIDINQIQLELLCDLLIGYTYARSSLDQKAEYIYTDVLEKARKSSIFNIIVLANYFKSLLLIKKGEIEEAMNIINDTLGVLQSYSNKMQIFYIMFEKLLVNTAEEASINEIDVDSEKQKLILISEDGKFSRFNS